MKRQSATWKSIPSIFGPKERVIHSILFAPFGFVNLVLNMIFRKQQRAYPTAENGIVLKTTRRLLCAPRFNYSAKDVPAEIAKVITQNEWRSLLNQLNNPMLKNSIGPFKWFLWVLLSHFHLLNAITLSEEQYAENGYSFSSPDQLCLWSADYGLYNCTIRSSGVQLWHPWQKLFEAIHGLV